MASQLSHSRWCRQIVFIINKEGAAIGNNRRLFRRSVSWKGWEDGARGQRCRFQPIGMRSAHTTITVCDKPHYRNGLSNSAPASNWKCVQSDKIDGSGSRNISSIAPWIKPGRKSISSGWLCSGAQPKQRSVYFECLSTSFIQAQIHFRRAVDTLRSKTRTR